MLNIFITGASGFIGKKLIYKLSKYNDLNIVLFDRKNGNDITDYNAVSKSFDTKIDVIVHLAGNTYVPESWNRPDKFISTNTLGTTNVLEIAKERSASVVFISTYMYGNPYSVPITEKHLEKVNNPYALSKLLAEKICRFYFDVHQVGCNVLRLFNVYGPHQDQRFLIPSIFRQALDNGKNITVNSLHPKRDYIYIDDAVNAIVSAIFVNNKSYNLINIASGESYSVEEVIDKIQRISGSNKKIICSDRIRKNEILDTRADISLANKVLDWKPTFSFDEGLIKIRESLV